jgi:predicted nuclease of predicted toxin-antitoxin system
MRILLDECLPRKLKNHLTGHSCSTVPEAGFAGKKNGELLKSASEADFEVFVTLDRGIGDQQNLAAHKLVILVLRAKSSRLEDLIPNIPGLMEILRSSPKEGLIFVSDHV